MRRTVRSLIGCVVISALVAASSGVAWAAPTLDQVSPMGSGAMVETSTSLVLQQGVTAGLTGLLTSIELYVYDPGTATIFINLGTPWQTDDNDFSAILTAPSEGWYSVDTSAAGINLTAGDTFAIGIGPADGAITFGINATDPSGDYAGGSLWGNEYEVAMLDLTFNTYVDPDVSGSTVPVPGALLLAGLGTALVAARRTEQ